ncbi:helix-turn-helix domain-containing protein [Halocatena marina]|uniref:helix-turn-helix domain-containing protein n=1 Tax=Halocatena marina TaxID=2934937 RepID=UPI0020105EAE|nr:helix-turn-helix domain-containing protein [Halocatena marina]
MKHIQVTATPDPDLIPHVYDVVSESESVTELRVLDWNLVADDISTLLYAIDGGATEFQRAARDTAGFDSVTLTNVDAATSYALIEARPSAIPFFNTIVTAVARAGMILRRPLVYRSNRSHGHVVGKPAPLQAMFDEVSDGIDVHVTAIGPFPCAAEDQATRLTNRQREIIETALMMGYYEQPRKTTHQDIADELGCGLSTVTEHLQKAEDTLVRSTINDEVHYRH